MKIIDLSPYKTKINRLFKEVQTLVRELGYKQINHNGCILSKITTKKYLLIL